MTLALQEIGFDHHGEKLPGGIRACARKDNGVLVGFRVRWRQADERGRQLRPSKSFSVRSLGSLDRALAAATFYLAGAHDASRIYRHQGRRPRSLTANRLFAEWLALRADELSRDYVEKMVRLWEREIAWRPMGELRLKEISSDPSLLVRSQDELVAEGLAAGKRREIWKLMRAVLRWGRRRHPNALTIEVSGLIELPRYERSRLPYVADAIGVERMIEAVLGRPTNDRLLALRDGALVAAMGFTVATRPSEWRLSATWGDLREDTIELQRIGRGQTRALAGLKRGAHVALVLPNAHSRLMAYRCALAARYGPQPRHALIFQMLDSDGPVWAEPGDGGKPISLAWNKNAYTRWVRRVWVPAREIASKAPDAPPGLEAMTFYDCRHTAISMALHSTLVMGTFGMNLHPLAALAGHDIETLEHYYRHVIARYVGKPPIDLHDECAEAREMVEKAPFEGAQWRSRRR